MKVFVVEIRSNSSAGIDAVVCCIVSSLRKAKALIRKKTKYLKPTQWWAVYAQMVDGGSSCEEMYYFNHLGKEGISQKLMG